MSEANPARHDSGYAYRRVRDDIRRGIDAGEYPPGALLPSVREITTRWQVSTTTARRALHELVLDGFARAQSRRGHVSTASATATSAGSGAVQSGLIGRLVVRRTQIIPAEAAISVADEHVSAVDVRRELPPPEVSLALDLGDAEHVIVRRRIFVDPNGVPVHFRTSYLQTQMADGTPLAGTEVLDAPWPIALALWTDRHVDVSTTQTLARHPNDVEAAALDLRADAAVLVRDDVTYDPQNKPLDFTRNVWPGDTTRLTGRYVTRRPT